MWVEDESDGDSIQPEGKTPAGTLNEFKYHHTNPRKATGPRVEQDPERVLLQDTLDFTVSTESSLHKQSAACSYATEGGGNTHVAEKSFSLC